MDLPIECQLDPKLGLFRITRARGKTLSSGGFGVAISTDIDASCNETTPTREDKSTVEKTSKITHQYLFVEEVLFLHERGLLECRDTLSSEFLDTSQLYQLLPPLQVSLPIYFVYAHLRSQDFRVLRHSHSRLEMLREQVASGAPDNVKLKEFKRKMRTTLEQSPPPRIPDIGLHMCFDVYMPNATFSKLNPGLPDFVVATTFYNESRVSFTDCQKILAKCEGIRLKIATVSDSGTVVMFGLTNFGVPLLEEKEEPKQEPK